MFFVRPWIGGDYQRNLELELDRAKMAQVETELERRRAIEQLAIANQALTRSLSEKEELREQLQKVQATSCRGIGGQLAVAQAELKLLKLSCVPQVRGSEK